MLTRVRIAGFKAIPASGVELALRPLTLLVGPTGSGKSSILEAIALTAQSTRTETKIQLTTAGRLVRLSDDTAWPRSHIDLLHGYDPSATLEVEVGLELIGASQELTFGFRASQLDRGHEANFEQWVAEGSERVHFHREVAGGGFKIIATHGAGSWSVSGDLQRLLDRALFAAAPVRGFGMVADRLAAYLTSAMLRYIGPWHGAPLLVSPDPTGPAGAAGTFGEHVLRVLAQSGPRSARLRRAFRAAERFGLPNLKVGVENGALVAWFDDPVTGVRVQLDHAGSGSHQALPILTDLSDVETGGCVMIEELERGSHPAFLIAWGETLADTVAHGAQVLATTHSPDLVLACALAVKRGNLAPEDVIVYELGRTAEGVGARAVEIGSDGRLSEGFIHSYRDAERELLGGLFDASDGDS